MRSSTAVDWSSPTIRRPTISAGDLCYRAGRSAGSAGLSAGKGEALGGRADVPTKMVELRFLVKVSLPVEAGNAAAKKDGQGHSDHPRTAIAANALVRSGDTIIRLEDRGDRKPAERLREGADDERNGSRHDRVFSAPASTADLCRRWLFLWTEHPKVVSGPGLN
jgi:hypothetical protein